MPGKGAMQQKGTGGARTSRGEDSSSDAEPLPNKEQKQTETLKA
jgi:hypothetical protein